tara:strand:+ start:1374 stop:1652 length:279 start_codon:yes stop_codon:yes gene_type:complete
MIEVSFKAPEEIDLALYYLDRQFQRFEDEGILIPSHEISLNSESIVILMWYPEDDDDSNDGGGDDPIWPIEPKAPEPGFAIEFEPDWIESWS